MSVFLVSLTIVVVCDLKLEKRKVRLSFIGSEKGFIFTRAWRKVVRRVDKSFKLSSYKGDRSRYVADRQWRMRLSEPPSADFVTASVTAPPGFGQIVDCFGSCSLFILSTPCGPNFSPQPNCSSPRVPLLNVLKIPYHE